MAHGFCERLIQMFKKFQNYSLPPKSKPAKIILKKKKVAHGYTR